MAALDVGATAPHTSSTDLLPRSRRGRLALVGVAALAPLSQLAWSLLLPYDLDMQPPELLAVIEGDPRAFEIATLTQTFFGLTAGISALVVGAAARQGSPRLGVVATVIAVIGGAVGWSAAAPAAIVAGFDIGLDQAAVLELANAVDAQAAGQLGLVTFPLIPLGYLLLGVSAVVAARRGAVPMWAAVILAVSVPLVLGGGMLARPLLALGWLTVVIGVGGVASAWARAAVSGR